LRFPIPIDGHYNKLLLLLFCRFIIKRDGTIASTRRELINTNQHTLDYFLYY